MGMRVTAMVTMSVRVRSKGQPPRGLGWSLAGPSPTRQGPCVSLMSHAVRTACAHIQTCSFMRHGVAHLLHHCRDDLRNFESL